MPAPTDAGRVESSTGANLSTHTIYLGSPTLGQLLVLLIRPGLSTSEPTVPGFTLLGSSFVDAADETTYVFTKVADGTEGVSVEATTSALCKLAAICWKITNGEAPTIGTIATGSGANAANPGPASPAGAPRDTLYLAMMGLDGELNTPTGPPAGYGNFIAVTSGTAGGVATNVSVAGASKAALASSSDDAGAFSHPAPNLGWTALTVAVRYGVYVTPPATGASSGKPGTFTPAGSTIPANLAAMSTVVASPSSAWYSGEYVVLGDASEASWNGSAWVAGRGTAQAPAITKLAEIRDDFSRPTIASAWWPTVVGATIDGAGVAPAGRVALPCTVDPGSKIESPPLDLRLNEILAWSYPVACNSAATRFRRTSLKVLLDEANYFEVYTEGTSSYVHQSYMRAVKAGSIIAGMSSEISYDPNYDAVWRIRADATSVYVETGTPPDPPATGPWTFAAWVTCPLGDAFPITAVRARLSCFRTAGDTAGGVAYFDQVNLRIAEVGPAPPSPPATGIAVKRWTGSAWQDATVKRWTGSAWATATPKRRDADGTWK